MAGEPGRIIHRRARTTAARAIAAVEDENVKRRRLIDQAEHNRAATRKLCGEFVSEEEMTEFMRTGVVPPRILKQHNADEREPAPWE